MKKLSATCPNCSHRFDVQPEYAPSQTPRFVIDQPAVEEFELRVMKAGAYLHPAPSRDLYAGYLALCPDLPAMTLRRFTTALLATGRWEWSRNSSGRVYRRVRMSPEVQALHDAARSARAAAKAERDMPPETVSPGSPAGPAGPGGDSAAG